MSKIFKNAAIIIIALLLLQTTCYAKAMSPTEDGTPLEETINVETLEKNQLITLVKEKVYILSYPVSSDDWKISKVMVQVKSVGWLTIREGEENSYLRIEECEAEQGRIAIKVTCKSNDIIDIQVSIQNERTGEVKDYGFKVTVSKSAEEQKKPSSGESNWIILIPITPVVPEQPEEPSEPNEPEEPIESEQPEEPTESEEPEQPTDPSETEEPDDTDEPENPKEPEKPGEAEEPEETEKPTEKKKIDTSGWVFQGVKAVYDGNEYVAIVTGLPDYVTAVYVDNTRTNAGSNTAYVTFEVPEEYEVPEGMETEIIIDKADIVIDGITLDKSLMVTNLVNGTISLHMPTDVTPTEVSKGIVNCTYVVNGEDVGSSYTITDTGIYSVVANFSLAEGMEENYNLSAEAIKAIYQVNPELINGNSPKFNLQIDEHTISENEIGIDIWMDRDPDETFWTSAVSWLLRYDTDILELESSTAFQEPYIKGDSSSGQAASTTSGAFGHWQTVQYIVFKVKDNNAKNIVVNITNIEANDPEGSLEDHTQTVSTNGTGILLRQENANIISVTLPNPQPVTKTSVVPDEEQEELPEEEPKEVLDEEQEELPDEEPKEVLDEEQEELPEEEPEEALDEEQVELPEEEPEEVIDEEQEELPEEEPEEALDKEQKETPMEESEEVLDEGTETDE